MERDVTLEESRFPQENQCKLQGIMSVMKFAWIISPMINTKVSCFRENCPKQDKCWLIFLNPDIIYFVFWLLFGISQSNWKTFFFFLFFFIGLYWLSNIEEQKMCSMNDIIFLMLIYIGCYGSLHLSGFRTKSASLC